MLSQEKMGLLRSVWPFLLLVALGFFAVGYFFAVSFGHESNRCYSLVGMKDNVKQAILFDSCTGRSWVNLKMLGDDGKTADYYVWNPIKFVASSPVDDPKFLYPRKQPLVVHE